MTFLNDKRNEQFQGMITVKVVTCSNKFENYIMTLTVLGSECSDRHKGQESNTSHAAVIQS